MIVGVLGIGRGGGATPMRAIPVVVAAGAWLHPRPVLRGNLSSRTVSVVMVVRNEEATC